MTTAFIPRKALAVSLFKTLWILVAMSMALAANAVDVGLAGVFPGKALLTIDGGTMRTVKVGATTPEGVKLISADGETATIEVDGQKKTLKVGQNAMVRPSEKAGGASVTLAADSRGHFLTAGQINGTTIRFMVDTGATLIVLGSVDARRVGLKPDNAREIRMQTANGDSRGWLVKLNTVRIGDITLYNIDAAILEVDMPTVLLGMSFLNRMEMQRSSGTMTLKKLY